MNDERVQNEHFHEPLMRINGSRTAANCIESACGENESAAGFFGFIMQFNGLL